MMAVYYLLIALYNYVFRKRQIGYKTIKNKYLVTYPIENSLNMSKRIESNKYEKKKKMIFTWIPVKFYVFLYI